MRLSATQFFKIFGNSSLVENSIVEARHMVFVANNESSAYLDDLSFWRVIQLSSFAYVYRDVYYDPNVTTDPSSSGAYIAGTVYQI